MFSAFQYCLASLLMRKQITLAAWFNRLSAMRQILQETIKTVLFLYVRTFDSEIQIYNVIWCRTMVCNQFLYFIAMLYKLLHLSVWGIPKSAWFNRLSDSIASGRLNHVNQSHSTSASGRLGVWVMNRSKW